MTSTDRSSWFAPVLVVGGLVLFGLAFASWGVGTEGVEPSVSGLGKVTVPGATADDVALLADHTGRPGLITLGLGLIIALAAVLSWWRTELRRAGCIVAMLAGAGALVWTLVTVRAPASNLFDAAVNETLGEGPSVLRSGWGLLGSVVVAGVCVAVSCTALVREFGRTDTPTD